MREATVFIKEQATKRESMEQPKNFIKFLAIKNVIVKLKSNSRLNDRMIRLQLLLWKMKSR